MKTFIATLIFGAIAALQPVCAQDLAFSKTTSVSVSAPATKATISAFHVDIESGKSLFNWNASSNEKVDRFELESSTDGRHFSTVALVFASEKMADENYQYFAKSKQAKTQYRLKLILKDQSVTYSGIIIAHHEKHN